jgi:hypothetical protein
MRKIVLLILILTGLVLVGCSPSVNIEVPDGYYDRPAKLNSAKVPDTTSHNECRDELYKAYAYIRSLERKVVKLEETKAELKAKKSRLEKRLEKYED